MPLYNQQTNLQGQGRFAPGVQYYAGIRAPAQPIPSLPKAESSFNIDLSEIGRAYISSQELQLKKQDAEADRAFRQGLAEMEDKRYRELEAIKDAREREFHADTVDYQNKSLAIDEFKALSSYDLGLRQLLMNKEKEEKGSPSDIYKRKQTELLTEIDLVARKARLRMQQDPNYTRDKASDDVYNYISDIQTNYPEYIKPADVSSIADNYGFGFGGIKKAEDTYQYNQANASENDYQITREATGLKYMPDAQARKMYQNTLTQVDAFQKWKQVSLNPYTTDEQRKLAFSEMQNAGINLARLGTLNNLYEFATKEIKAGDYTNYRTMATALKNKTINSLASSMDYTSAINYYDVAAERLGVNKFLESYNQEHKINAEVADNIKNDMLNNIEGNMLFTIPQWRSYKALGGNINSIVQSDPNFAQKLGEEVLGIVKLNGVTYNSDTKEYIYNNKEYSSSEVLNAMQFFGVNDPYAAVILSAVTEARNMPTLVDQGLATEKDVNEAVNAEHSLLTYPGKISTKEDATIVASNIDAAQLYEQMLWCRSKTGTEEAARMCVTDLQFGTMLKDDRLELLAHDIGQMSSAFGSKKTLGIKLTQGNGIELGFIDDNVDISDSNLKLVSDYTNYINRYYSNMLQDSKIMHLRAFDGNADIEVLDKSYTGPFKTAPSTMQKGAGKVFETDMKISQLHDESEQQRLNKEIDKELKQLKSIEEQSAEEPDKVIRAGSIVENGVSQILVGNEEYVFINGERFIVPKGRSDEELLSEYKQGALEDYKR